MIFPKIKEHGLFRTPESTEEIYRWIDAHLPEDRGHLYTAAMMMYNVMAKSINYLQEDYLEELRERIGDGSHYGDEDEEHDPFINYIKYITEDMKL